MEPIRVIMLGPTQSGKTLFLSAMWQKLQWPLDPGFHLETVTADGYPDTTSRNKLDRIYNQLISQQDFPPGTSLGSKANYRFACHVQVQQKSFKACDFEYLDYAGGLLNSESIQDEDFDAAVNEADILLGLLDGVNLLRAMSADSDAQDWISQELAPVLVRTAATLRKAKNRTLSIHFVISKWDAIGQLAPHLTLEQFKKFLLDIPAVQALLGLTDANATVRLIPVSALGTGFAQMESETIDDGNGNRRLIVYTRKRHLPESMVTPIPTNVEIPIACCIPDVLTQRLAALTTDKAQLGTKLERLDSAQPSFAQRLKGIRVPVLRELGNWLARTEEQRRTELVTTLRERHRQVTDTESAFQYLVQFCSAVRDSFEKEEPHSILKRGRL
ncbi:hypothetical protein [Armatimonas rosea]|uniref:Uncharacterized protein n=1 Tax=Armatimonas rosea TaxID=685828 RepID=A0A7W9W907_ARMRO|nr:hypothetical protein [Armatimonas rosea]MBB6052695.1 hypothetical protein [Armatimonas rosea]